MIQKEELLTEIEWVCFDLETTGLSPYQDSILEIGAVRFCLGNNQTKVFQSFIQFEGEIPEATFEIHHIESEWVRSAPPLKEILPKFLDFIGDCPLMAHNASFDVSMLANRFSPSSSTTSSSASFPVSSFMPHPSPEPPKNPIFDTLDLSKKLLPQNNKHSLEELKKYFAVHVERSHRALDDAKATSEIFSKILAIPLKDDSFQTLGDLTELSAPRYFSNSVIDQKAFTSKAKIIHQAIQNNSILYIRYQNGEGKKTLRRVEPKNLIITEGHYYLEGFCFLRQDERRFRLDRIQDIEGT